MSDSNLRVPRNSAPRLLDLFCGAGGAAAGYAKAGFEVVGWDIHPQPRYPFAFVQGDVLALFRTPGYLQDFDAIHASPPCQGYSDLQLQNKRTYPLLIEPTRELLASSGLLYVIENVEGAPLLNPTVLCGTMFPGLRVIRHRLFESNAYLWPAVHPLRHPLVWTTDKRKAHYGQLDQATAFVSVNGGGNCSVANARLAMGIDWMTKDELNEAIPPAYTEWLGLQLRADLMTRRAAA